MIAVDQSVSVALPSHAIKCRSNRTTAKLSSRDVGYHLQYNHYFVKGDDLTRDEMVNNCSYGFLSSFSTSFHP